MPSAFKPSESYLEVHVTDPATGPRFWNSLLHTPLHRRRRCPTLRSFFASLLVFSALLASSFPQEAPSSQVAKLTVAVNVLDTHGNAVRDLAKENFHLRLDGKPVAILDARYNLAPRRLVVLLDMSASMTGENDNGKWRIASEAVQDLLTQTPVDMTIAMLTFADTVRDVFDFPGTREAITRWLNEGQGRRPNLSGRTAVFDAMLAGLKLLSPVQSGDAIYVISDGEDNASHATLGITRNAVLHSGVRAFALLFDKPSPGWDDPVNAGTRSREEDVRDSLRNMAEDSGGSVFGVSGVRTNAGSSHCDYTYGSDNREMVKLYTKELGVQINGFWTLEIAVPSSIAERRMRLEIFGPEGLVRKNVRASYPRFLLVGN